MLIIGCDFHPGFQQVAIFDNLTGEYEEKRLRHREEAEQVYVSRAGAVRVGMEACGHYPRFERLLAGCGHELWLGDAGKIRSTVVRKQKTDRRDAEHILQLLAEERFPRIWVPRQDDNVEEDRKTDSRTRFHAQAKAGLEWATGARPLYWSWNV